MSLWPGDREHRIAGFFYRQDALIPRRYVDYARWLLSTIESSESWGIPAVARGEFHLFFKGGWLPEVEGLVNQAGRLEGHGITFAMAVMSTHDPSMEYGEGTIEGVTARLLGRAVSAEALAHAWLPSALATSTQVDH